MRIYPQDSPYQQKEVVDQNLEGMFLKQLLGLPHKILMNNEVMGLAPLILHELGHDSAFNFTKASYLVNNPDFDCVRGFAGYHEDDCKHHESDMWGDAEMLTHAMQSAPFNQSMMTFYDKGLSTDRNGELTDEALQRLCGTLGINNASFLTWKMRHGNHGILLVEADGLKAGRHRDLLHHFVPLLSFC